MSNLDLCKVARRKHDEIENLEILSLFLEFFYIFAALTSHAGKILAAISPPASKYCKEWSVRTEGYRME
jgi:hypothetical protein